MKEIFIIAGPNGAGKTTFAHEFLPGEAACFEFVNADLIAAGLSPFRPDRVALQAGRLMLKRLEELAASGSSFALETTLATRVYLPMIPRWQAAGYSVKLYFLKLPNPDFATKRVAQRVALGGHDIPKETIRRRFFRGLENLTTDYSSLVDEWFLYDGSKTPPLLIEDGGPPQTPQLMEAAARYSQRLSQPDSQKQAQRAECIAGAEAALKRASEKAIARALAAGLEPIVAKQNEEDEKPTR